MFYPTRKLSDSEQRISAKRGYHYTVLVKNSVGTMTIQELHFTLLSEAMKCRSSKNDIVLKVFTDGSAVYKNGPYKGCSYATATKGI